MKTTLILCLLVVDISCLCPKDNLIAPCVCSNDNHLELLNAPASKRTSIRCDGIGDDDLANIFNAMENNLSKIEKHFNELTLDETTITELKDNAFRGITFDKITIINCKSLQKISANAFNGTDLVTKELIIMANERLSSPDQSIFKALSKFINVEQIQLIYNNITEIPWNAFFSSAGNHTSKLWLLGIMGESITKLDNFAFYSLDNLKNLTIAYTSIQYIPEYAFYFERKTDKTLNLSLLSNFKLSASSFHSNALAYLQRPTAISLGGERVCNDPIQQFEYLDKSVFRKFLLLNDNNKVDMLRQQLDCDKQENLWFKDNLNLMKRIDNLRCNKGCDKYEYAKSYMMKISSRL